MSSHVLDTHHTHIRENTTSRCFTKIKNTLIFEYLYEILKLAFGDSCWQKKLNHLIGKADYFINQKPPQQTISPAKAASFFILEMWSFNSEPWSDSLNPRIAIRESTNWFNSANDSLTYTIL